MASLNKLRNKKGQALVEFAICIIIFFLFVFGIMGASIWGLTSFVTQEVAHESARKYAVTNEKSKSEELGKVYMKRWAYIFIDDNSVQISVSKEGNKAVATVTAKPKASLQKLFIFSMPQISKTSEATLEDFIRNPSNYVGGL